MLSQSYGHIELIIVDDASTDNTSTLVSSYRENVFYLRHSVNQGVSHARNTGIAIAKGEYICFLDSDDEWMPHKLETQIQLLNKKNYILIHGEEIWIRNGKRVNPKKIHRKYGGWIFERCLSRCLISPSSVMINKKALVDSGGFDETFLVCEDYDLWIRLTPHYEVGWIKEPIITKYGGHPDQLSRKYKAMDYYRVLSLDRIRKNPTLTEIQKSLVAHEIQKKANILIHGHRKHNKIHHLEQVNAILENLKN